MVNLFMVVLVTLIVSVVGGGGAYLIWLLTRPKKLTWKAKVYQLGEGVKPPIKDKKGNIISDVMLSDLKPFALDVVERVEKEHGITVYRLIKMNKTIPAVTSDVVEFWGMKKKEVSILYESDTCTLLKRGYDRKAGMIFTPMESDRINMIKGEMSIRKDRLRKEKDIFQAITPWVVTGMAMLALVAISYIVVTGLIDINEKTNNAIKQVGDQINSASNLIASTVDKINKAQGIVINETKDLGAKEKPPPSIE